MSSQLAKKPRDIFRAHPIVGWTLTPNRQVEVGFRPGVIQNIDAQGNRHIPHAPPDLSAKRLAIYGCSFTYGTGLADAETYPALLQEALPSVRVINKGVGGHGSVQALLRFRADLLDQQVDAAVFGMISDHRYRNLPHPYRMKAHLSPDWHRIGVEQVPHARLDRSGKIEIVFTPTWQPCVLRNDFAVFLPDEHVFDLVTIGVFQEILALADAHRVPVLIALLDQIDPQFNQLMIQTFCAAHDVSTPYEAAYHFQPDDLHPNALANRCFAERLLPIVEKALIHPAHQ